MSTVSSVGSAAAPSPAGQPDVWRWISTSNPLYVISAGLFLAGLFLSFGAQAQTWALLSGLAGYTILLAVTACLLVRLAKVWDDVRTILLLVVLMFLATSVTFDEVLALEPERGAVVYLAGWLLALVVSEGVLRGIRLRLPGWFRLPYYLILTLFFLYPLALSPWIGQPDSDVMQWGLFGFASVAGLIFLTLLPAIWKGAGYIESKDGLGSPSHGNPWRWPLYPWVLFGLLALAVPARAVLLCWSLHVLDVRTGTWLIFGPYFLVPFGLVMAVLLLEIGVVRRREQPQGDYKAGIVLGIALAAPLGLIFLTQLGRDDPVFQGFLGMFQDRLGGSPLFFTLLAAAGFYAYAACRRVPLAVEGLSVMLATLAFMRPDTMRLADLAPANPMPLLGAAGLHIILGVLRRTSWHWLAGLAGMMAAASFFPWPGEVQPYRDLLMFHAGLVVALALGALLEDVLAQLVRGLAITLIFLICLSMVLTPWPRLTQFGWLVDLYPLLVAVLLGIYGLALRYGPAQGAALGIATLWLAALAWRGYLALRTMMAGLDYLTLGLLAFAAAVAVSLVKGRRKARRFN